MNKHFENSDAAPTIGLFANTFYDEYQISILEGVKKATGEHGYNLICFIGGSINNPYFDNKSRNAIYDLACQKNVDGILAISVSIGSYIDRNILKDFLQSFSPVPLISIGIPFDTIPSVYIDNTTSMYNLVSHLIEIHGYKRIAFIRGPKTNADAEARFTSYKEVLTKHNIVIDPKLIIDGSFHVNSGQSAVTQLIDDRKVSFDVLIGANDYVAINAISELTRRGIHVPGDIAVVGFDDVTESQSLDHPLTTVNQPSFLLGYKAAMIMFSLLKNEEICIKTKIPSEVIIRRSCGCRDREGTKSHEEHTQIDTNKYIEKKMYIPALAAVIKGEFPDILSASQIDKMSEQLFVSLINDLEQKKVSAFLMTLKKIINTYAMKTLDVISLHTIIYFILIKIIPGLDVTKSSDFIFLLFKKASKLIDTMTIRNMKQSIVKANECEMHLFSVKKMLHMVFDTHHLNEIIKKEFPSLGIKSCFISMYTNSSNDLKASTELIAAYKEYTCILDNYSTHRFSPALLVPGGLKNIMNSNTFVILSLSYKKELLGFVIYELEKREMYLSSISSRSICEILTIELSNTIKSIKLFNQVEEQIKYIEKNADESSGTDYMASVNEEKLKEYYRQVLLYMENEKPYMDLDLTLPCLAEQLDIPRNHLSYALNKYARVNFYGFVNSYRIKEAKLHLEKDTRENINILDVAFNCGFKSKSTFYKVFKRYTHVTPTDYRNEYLKTKENEKA